MRTSPNRNALRRPGLRHATFEGLREENPGTKSNGCLTGNRN
jgi:hypothetical protein